MGAAIKMPVQNASPLSQGISAPLIPSPENTRAFRDALGRFATGVTIITTNGSHGPVGMTANSFASVSLDPALVLWSLAKSSGRYEPFAKAKHYAIHVLATDQQALAMEFARKGAPFDQCVWRKDENDVPIIENCLARFDCIQSAAHEAGDHTIIVGEVASFEEREGEPLVFANCDFGKFSAGS